MHLEGAAVKVQSAEFVKSCITPDQYPRSRVPEVALAGRSNVGKSSAINSLLNHKGLAKVGKVPGKTQTVNFFGVTTNDPHLQRFHLVDLPGYGYAKVPHTIRQHWGPMVEGYLTSRQTLCGVIVFIDARGNQPQDKTLVKWLNNLSCRMIFVATKADKISRGKRPAHLQGIRQDLGLRPETELVLYSARTHEGRPELLRALKNFISAKT